MKQNTAIFEFSNKVSHHFCFGVRLPDRDRNVILGSVLRKCGDQPRAIVIVTSNAGTLWQIGMVGHSASFRETNCGCRESPLARRTCHASANPSSVDNRSCSRTRREARTGDPKARDRAVSPGSREGKQVEERIPGKHESRNPHSHDGNSRLRRRTRDKCPDPRNA